MGVKPLFRWCIRWAVHTNQFTKTPLQDPRPLISARCEGVDRARVGCDAGGGRRLRENMPAVDLSRLVHEELDVAERLSALEAMAKFPTPPTPARPGNFDDRRRHSMEARLGRAALEAYLTERSSAPVGSSSLLGRERRASLDEARTIILSLAQVQPLDRVACAVSLSHH